MKSREFEPPKCEIVVIVHNIRSVLNVGAIFRSAEGFGVKKIFLSGTTLAAENSLPHVRAKMAKELHKTALGAEELVEFEYVTNLTDTIRSLSNKGYRIVGLEQDERAIPLPDYKHRSCNACDNHCKNGAYKIALVLGEEVHGLTPEIRTMCDDLVEIPMFGRKESFNVSVAAGIVLYGLVI
jgi:tRNA G18 (ribose-2'-O)-methylase SpoU